MSAPRRIAKVSPWSVATALAAALAVALCGVNAWFGPLNHDEGWYLLAAQNVARGMVPYRDFLYTQGPAMPLVYGALSSVWSPFGVLGGRALTAAFGLLAVLAFAAFAANIAGRTDPKARRIAFFFAVALLALSPDWAYFAVIPKTYALSALFLGGGFLLLSSCRRTRGAVFASGALFALAAATRATLCLAAPVAMLAIALDGGRPAPRRWRDAALFGAGCAVALAALYAPVLAVARENFVFSQTYHTARARAPLAAWLQTRAAFACFLAQGYPALVAAAAVLGASAKWRGAARPGAATAAAAVSFALVTAAHFAVPFPYADYNTPAMPLAAALLAAALARKVSSSAPDAVRPVPVIAATLVAAVAFVAASPWPMKWVGGRQDRFWFSTDSSSAVARLRQAGKAVREANAGGKPLLAQDAYIAVEAGAPVLPGLEMGPFSVFPGLSDDEARRRRVHTPQTLLNAVRGADCDVATIGGYTFALECPSTNPLDEALREDLLAAVRERFPLETMRFDRFGQQDTALEVRTRRGARQSGE